MPGLRQSLFAVALAILCLSATFPALSQQTAETPDIETNSKVEELLASPQPNQNLVELSGYVGPAAPDVVRLYSTLSLDRYMEIPRGAVRHVEGNAKAARVKIYVPGSTQVTFAVRGRADLAKASTNASRLSMFSGGDAIQPDDGCVLQCASCLLTPLGCIGCAICVKM